MRRVPTVFTVSPPHHPDPSRICRIRAANGRKAFREFQRRRFLRSLSLNG